MQFLLDVILGPIEFFIRLVMESSFKFTNSYGLSIIVVSGLVSLAVLPLYALADSWQDKERVIQAKLHPIIAEFKKAYKGWQLHAFVQTLYRQNRYHPIFALRAYFGIAIQIPFFFAAYRLLSQYSAFQGQSFLFIEDLAKPDQLLKIGSWTLNLLPFLMTAINLYSSRVYGSKLSLRENLQLNGLAIFFLIVLYSSPSGLLLYWTFNNLFALIRNLVSRAFAPKPAISTPSNETLSARLICTKAIEAFHRLYRFRLNSVFEPDQIWPLFTGYMLVTCTSMFLFTPLSLIESGSPKDFSGSLYTMLEANLIAYVTVLAGAALLFFLSPQFLRPFWTLVSILLCAFVLNNIFLFPPDYGDMSNLRYLGDIFISKSSKQANHAVTLAISLGILVLLAYKRASDFGKLWPLLLASLLFVSANSVYQYHELRKSDTSTESSTLKVDFRFSPNKPNVLILVLDRFIGGYMQKILEKHPEFFDDLDGFTWSPYALSSSSRTIGGAPGILGGWEYTVGNINQQRRELTLRQKIHESASILPYNFKRIGFETALFSLSPLSFSDLKNKQYLGDTHIENLIGKYTNLWLKEKHGLDYFIGEVSRPLLSFSIFRALPPSSRRSFYRDGRWKVKFGRGSDYQTKEDTAQAAKQGIKYGRFVNTTEMKQVYDNWSTLYFLPRISAVDSSIKNGTMQFFHSDYTHEPYVTGMSLEPEVNLPVAYEQSIFDEFHGDWESVIHYYTDVSALKALVRWFQWMKENGVYDNTRILIVSDHGRDVLNPMFGKDAQEKLAIRLSYFNCLYMFKDFKQRGRLKISDEFRANVDVPYVSMQGLIDGVNPFTRKKIAAPESKLPFLSSLIEWRPTRQSVDRYKVYASYLAKTKNIFELENWTRQDYDLRSDVDRRERRK